MARIPLIPNLSTKDGEANQNARMTNALSEKNPTGSVFAAVRPGLELQATAVGNGRGIVEFNDKILSVYGATLEIPVIPDRIGYGEENISTLANGSEQLNAIPLHSSTIGDTCVGYIATNDEAFIWQKGTDRMTLLGFLDETYQYSRAYFVSADGSSVIGIAKNSSNVLVPFIWNEDDGMSAISGFTDGTTITAATPTLDAFCGITGATGYIWRDGVGVTTFTATTCNAISDNYTVVGRSGTTIFKRLVDGTTTTHGTGTPTCISSDGSVFFGFLNAQGFNERPFRWDANGTVQLSSATGLVTSCNDDGTIAGGATLVSGNFYPFRWKQNTGIQVLNLDTLYLYDSLVESSSFMPTMCKLSRDGSTLAGVMYDGTNFKYSVFVYQYDYEDEVIIQQNLPNYTYYNAGVLSDDGWAVFTQIQEDENSNTLLYRWTRDTGAFRSIATLEDQFFDFVQSTL